MSKTRTKLLIFFMIAPVLAVAAVVILLGLSQFLAYFQQGADPASIFRGNMLILPLEDEAEWLSTVPPRGIAPSKSQQEELITAYWQGWQAVSRAYLTGQATDISTYWALPMLDTVQQSIPPEGGIEHQTHSHQLRLTFFSDDRSIASINDHFILEENGLILNVTADVTLTLDGSRWRIRYMTLDYSIKN